MRLPFEVVRQQIKAREGEIFHTKTKKELTYKVLGDRIVPSRTDFFISKTDFRKAYEKWPIDGPGRLNDLVRGPSYIWGILNDNRILGR